MCDFRKLNYIINWSLVLQLALNQSVELIRISPFQIETSATAFRTLEVDCAYIVPFPQTEYWGDLSVLRISVLQLIHWFLLNFQYERNIYGNQKNPVCSCYDSHSYLKRLVFTVVILKASIFQCSKCCMTLQLGRTIMTEGGWPDCWT